MIIVDMNQISLASVMMQLAMSKQTEPDINMVRHMILNSLRQYRSMFTDEYGELVIAYDSKHYWRKDYFPNYKANRKKGRESDNKDWDAIFGCLNQIKEEIREFFPYKVLEVHGAEADDIIAVIVKNVNEKILILSGDKDFIQLQSYTNVKQYSPITKKTIGGEDPVEYKRIHILKGDSSDGIPNVLSGDNTFVEGIRQSPLSMKKIQNILSGGSFPSLEAERNYQRNKTLIDLEQVPKEIESKIMQEFSEAPCGNRSKLLNYFVNNRLKELTESIGDF